MMDITNSQPDGPLTTAAIESMDEAPPGPGLIAPPPGGAPVPRVEDSRAKRVLKTVGWVVFGLACLIVFTLLKLPEDRIKNYAEGMIASQLAPRGVAFAAERGYVSIGFGLSYVMKGVTLTPPAPAVPTKIDKVSFTPSLLPMLLGRQGGTLWVYQGDGTLSASVSIKNTQVSGSFKAKNIDFGKIGVLPLAAGVNGSAVIASGAGSFSGDTAIPSTLSGEVELTLGKVALEPQTLMGFAVPRIQLTEGRVDLAADKGKANIKALRLGKPGSADDLQATATGDVLLGRNWDSSTANAKLNFKLSESILKAFIFIDAILGAGKQGDGSYTFTLSGPVTSPQFLPVK